MSERLDKLEAEILALITPDNVRLGHTWLRRIVAQAIAKHRQEQK